jgi:hypothetical protein
MIRHSGMFPVLLALILALQTVVMVGVTHARSVPTDELSASVVDRVDAPCHGMQADAAAPDVSGLVGPCCDADCPNMLDCSMGTLAAAPPLAWQPMVLAAHYDGAPPVRSAARSPAAALRPPIHDPD